MGPRDTQAQQAHAAVEAGLVGLALRHPTAVAEAIVGGIRSRDFQTPRWATAWDGITELFERGIPVDPTMVAAHLEQTGTNRLGLVGGLDGLQQAAADCPALDEAATYITTVADVASRRRIIVAGAEIARGDGNPEAAAATLAAAIDSHLGSSVVSAQDVLGELLDDLEARHDAARHDRPLGVTTGLVDLDRLLGGGLRAGQLMLVGSRPSLGKALALDTPIPTPFGWTTMGDVQTGDTVFDGQGRPCTVVGTSPIQLGNRCYEITFDEGTSVIADADHEWFAYDLVAWKSKREKIYRNHGGYSDNPCRDRRFVADMSHRRRMPRVVTTEQMLKEGCQRQKRSNWYLPLAQLDLPPTELAVDPYVFGCWLGDGTTSKPVFTIGDTDLEHFKQQFSATGYPLVPRGNMSYACLPIEGQHGWRKYRGPLRVLTRELLSLGLLGGATKHIPSQYMRASHEQRLALLQGFLDTDGHITRGGTVELIQSNRALLSQARELVCSLGHKPGPIREKKIKLPDDRTATAWRFTWTPDEQVFRLRRKAQRVRKRRLPMGVSTSQRRSIRRIRAIDSVSVRCITVNSPDHLYLATESMIPTHNSSLALRIALSASEAGIQPLYVSAEMSSVELMRRAMAQVAHVDHDHLRTGRLTDADWERITLGTRVLAERGLWIMDRSEASLAAIRAAIARPTCHIGLLLVDYLQLLVPHQGRTREEEVSRIVRGLKHLARDAQVPVVALSQISRKVEDRHDKRPTLADLRESGEQEQAADIVALLYRDDFYNRDSPTPGILEINVAKQREGPRGVVHAAFIDACVAVVNVIGPSREGDASRPAEDHDTQLFDVDAAAQPTSRREPIEEEPEVDASLPQR